MMTTENLKNLLKESLGEDFYFSISTITIGGVTLIVRLSGDLAKDWPHNIFQNSRYAIFSIDVNDGKIELISKRFDMPKFRKCKYKSEDSAAETLTNYIKKASQTVPFDWRQNSTVEP